MRAPSWHQNVLLVSDDTEIVNVISPAFGEETTLMVVSNTQLAMKELNKNSIQVMIIDAKMTNPVQNYYEKYFDEKEEIPFIELSQFACQLNLGVTIILLINKLLVREGEFARKCGATLIMDRKEIQINRMIYLIGVLRKRTFRTILTRDISINKTFSVDLYYFLSLSNRYAPYLLKGTPFTIEKLKKIASSNIRHLYVQEDDLHCFLSEVKKVSNRELYYSETLAAIRKNYRQWIIQVFDFSSDGIVMFGKELFDKGIEIVKELENLINSFPDPITCLQELPYPRWSIIAHSMNCGIYSLIFSKECNIEPRHEIAFAAMIHNLGFAEIDQTILKKDESSLTITEFEEYKKHIEYTINILKKKLFPLTPLMEKIILHHHENYDGTGFPSALVGSSLPLPVALVSIVSSFDYYNTVKPKTSPLSPFQAWQRLREDHSEKTMLNTKFHPQILSIIDNFFLEKK